MKLRETNVSYGLPAPLARLRPRVFKAVRATMLAGENQEERQALLDQWLDQIWREGAREPTFPEELAEAQQRALQEGWRRAVNRCRRLAGEWFSWEMSGRELVRILEAASAQMVRADEKTGSDGSDVSDLKRLVLHHLRRRWCGEAENPESFRVEEWLSEIGFFPRKRLEIGSWARFFHTIVALHREGAAIPALRQRKLKDLVEKVRAGRVLESIPEVIIYLEGQVRAEAGGEEFPGPFPPPLDPEVFFPRQDVDAVLRLIQEAQVFLTTAGQLPRFQQRLDWLAVRRELIDLKDLLFLILAAVHGRDPLPPPSQMLDQLQSRGYPIYHQDFRDDYTAWLTPLDRLWDTERATLRWPLDPADLTGDPVRDLDHGKSREERRRRAWQAFREGVAAFCQGRNEPLPRSELIRPAARFALSWMVAGACVREEALNLEALVSETLRALGSPLLKLIRPRKGYELKHKGALQEFLTREGQAYQEALERWRRTGVIANLYDDGLLFSLGGALALREKVSDLEALKSDDGLILELGQVSAASEELARRLHLDLKPAGQPWWHEFQTWLRKKLEWETLPSLGDKENIPAADWEEAAGSLFLETAGQLYRLAAARARKEQGLAPLPGDPTLLYWVAAWFTPTWQPFRDQVNRQLLQGLEERAKQAVWETYPLRLENREELISLIKYFLAEELQGQSLEVWSRRHNVTELITKIVRRLQSMVMPPEVMPFGGMAAAVQEVLRPRAPEEAEAQRRLEESILALLPRSDCGSCGVPGCLTFARLLALGRAAAGQCLQAPVEVKQQIEKILTQSLAGTFLLEPHVLAEADCRRLSHLLDPYFMAMREQVSQELGQEAGQTLVPLKPEEISILQIGKSPDAATFHHYLANYLGAEGAERLTFSDRAFLVTHGEVRLAAEARDLAESFSWRALDRRTRLSVFALAPQDPATQARQYYEGKFILSELSDADQENVREFRLRQYLSGFLEEWEQALPEHWEAGYRIEDWDDFAQIMAKSYWHQEHTPAPGEIWGQLPSEVVASREVADLAEAYLENLVRRQIRGLEQYRQRLESLLKSRRISSLDELEVLGKGMATRAWLESVAAAASAPTLAVESSPRADLTPAPTGRSLEATTTVLLADRIRLLTDKALNLLEQGHLTIAGSLRIYPEAIPARVREILSSDPRLAPEELAGLFSRKEGTAWRELHTCQGPWLRAQVQSLVEELAMEEQEVIKFRQGGLNCPTPETLRRAARQLYLSGLRDLSDLLDTLGAWLTQASQGWPTVRQAAFQDLAWQRLQMGAYRKTKAEANPLVKFLDQALRAQTALDLPKLKAYLFLLARMEGNLDKLTALLREIRETSDIIEAAWLAFTEERVAQSGNLTLVPGPGQRTPVPASRLPDKERFNRYLEEGLPRGEPREYSQAYREFITLLQFYIVNADPEDDPEILLERLEADQYDLNGLSREAILAAVRHQAQHRESLMARKISICTQVLAHRLAIRDPHLAQSAAGFLQHKGAFLKEEGLAAEMQKGRIATHRGVDLGRVRNELYHMIADLLRDERSDSFAQRIDQIIDRLEEERQQTLKSFWRGELNRFTAFYILRRYQKEQARVATEDLARFLRQRQPEKLAGVRERLAPVVKAEVEERLQNILAGYQEVLAVTGER